MPKKRSVKIADAYIAYHLDAQARRVTASTLRTYHDRVEPFIRWCTEQEAPHLQDLTATLIRSYLIQLQDRQLSSYTVNGIARAIKAFLNFCISEELITESPMRRVTVPKVDKKIMPAFSEDDAAALLAACKTEREEAVLLFLLDTGVRGSEFIKMNGGYIDITTGAV